MQKKDVVVEIATILGKEPPKMSTGSTEPREIFDLVNEELGLGLGSNLTKPQIAQAIVESTGEVWLPDHESRGGTVTLSGLRAVLRAVVFYTRGGEFADEDENEGEEFESGPSPQAEALGDRERSPSRDGKGFEDSRQEVVRVPVSSLSLDPENPRLPPDVRFSIDEQDEIALYINKHYDPLRIAQSIADHRFFESEPLIATERSGRLVVIEGNRRLTALVGLARDDLRTRFAEENKGWGRIPRGRAPSHIPVLVVEKAKDVAALLGYRHISGIEPWEPYSQAHYISQLVNREGYPLEQVAELVGRKKTEVASRYRDFDILRQADDWGIDTSRARRSFGVFTNAMGRRNIRSFIGAPDPRAVDPDFWPLEDGSRSNVSLLLELIFGASNGKGRVISDSRELGQLAAVLGDETGVALRVLRKTRSLDEALDAAQDPNEQLQRALNLAKQQLAKAQQLDVGGVSDSTMESLIQIRRLADKLIGRSRTREEG